MIRAPENWNGSRDLTTTLSGVICHPYAMINLSTKFEVSISDTKRRKWGGLGYLGQGIRNSTIQ